jgi:hypothetical protein
MNWPVFLVPLGPVLFALGFDLQLGTLADGAVTVAVAVRRV